MLDLMVEKLVERKKMEHEALTGTKNEVHDTEMFKMIGAKHVH